MTKRDTHKNHSMDAFRLALTGLKDYHADNPEQAHPAGKTVRNQAALVWKKLITDLLLESASKIPDMPDWVPPETAKNDIPHAPVELAGLIYKWTDEFNETLLRQCFSILRFQKRLLCPESYWRILSTFGNKPNSWSLLQEVIGPEADFLAKKNTSWSWWTDIKTDRSWTSNNLKNRLKYFHFLRHTEPLKALELISKSWANEDLQSKKQLMHLLQFGQSKEDIPFLEKTLKERGLEIRTLSLLYLARLEEPGIVQNLNRRFHKFMEDSLHYSGESLKFDPASSLNSLPDNQYSKISIFKDDFHDDRLRWLILVHPREFIAYIGLEYQLKRLLSTPELHLLSGILILSIAFHREKNWAERLIEYWPAHHENHPRQTIPWESILNLLPSEIINRIISELPGKDLRQTFVKLSAIARGSNVIWSLKNSLNIIDMIVEILGGESYGPMDELFDLPMLSLRLDPGVFTKFDQSLGRVLSFDSMPKEVRVFRNTLLDRFRMTRILLSPE